MSVPGCSRPTRHRGWPHYGQLGSEESGSPIGSEAVNERLPRAGYHVNSDILTGDPVEWENFDPERIPEDVLGEALSLMEYDDAVELLEQHPEHQKPSKWDVRIEKAEQLTGFSVLSLLLGLGAMSIEGTQYSDRFPEFLYALAAAALVGGAFFAFVGTVALSLLHATERFVNSPYMETLETNYDKALA